VTTIGYPDPLSLFGLLDRRRAVSAEGTAVLLEAAAAAAADLGIPAAQLGVVADDASAVLDAAAARGWVRAVPVDEPGGGPFELADEDGFGRRLEELEASVAHVPLSWNPGDAPEDRKAQAMQLAKLAAWLHTTDRKLLVDLQVPASPSDLEPVDGDRARFRAELHPGLVRRAVQEIRDLGIEADLWVVEPTGTPEDVTALAELVREAGRDEVALLVSDGADDAAVRTAARVTGYRGVVAGRSVWGEPLAALEAGRVDREEAVRSIGDGFRRRLETFRSAAGH
jgi:myo-inositol catabolism protein IolC